MKTSVTVVVRHDVHPQHGANYKAYVLGSEGSHRGWGPTKEEAMENLKQAISYSMYGPVVHMEELDMSSLMVEWMMNA